MQAQACMCGREHVLFIRSNSTHVHDVVVSLLIFTLFSQLLLSIHMAVADSFVLSIRV